MKCARCGADLPAGRVLRFCRTCWNAYQRAHRPRYRDLSPEARRRADARARAGVALRRGKLVRQPCQVCGDPKSQMHHPDYSKPLEVDWLCARCHRAEHEGEKEAAA